MKTVTSLVKNSIWWAATLLATVTYGDCTKKKQPEAETSLVFDLAHPGYQKTERELNEWRERKKRNKNAKHVKCKDVLWFICGIMKQG